MVMCSALRYIFKIPCGTASMPSCYHVGGAKIVLSIILILAAGVALYLVIGNVTESNTMLQSDSPADSSDQNQDTSDTDVTTSQNTSKWSVGNERGCGKTPQAVAKTIMQATKNCNYSLYSQCIIGVMQDRERFMENCGYSGDIPMHVCSVTKEKKGLINKTLGEVIGRGSGLRPGRSDWTIQENVEVVLSESEKACTNPSLDDAFNYINALKVEGSWYG